MAVSCESWYWKFEKRKLKKSLALFVREAKSEMKIWSTHFENEKWNANALRLRMRNKMKMPWDRDQEWKVKWKCFKIEMEKLDFSRILKKFLRIRNFSFISSVNCFTLHSTPLHSLNCIPEWMPICTDCIAMHWKQIILILNFICFTLPMSLIFSWQNPELHAQFHSFSREKEWNLRFFHCFWEMKSETNIPFREMKREIIFWFIFSSSRSENEIPREVKFQKISREFLRNETLAVQIYAKGSP